MRGQKQQIVSKISKFGNFTIRKGLLDNNNEKKGGTSVEKKHEKDVVAISSGRAPLGQISLNVAAVSSNTTTTTHTDVPPQKLRNSAADYDAEYGQENGGGRNNDIKVPVITHGSSDTNVTKLLASSVPATETVLMTSSCCSSTTSGEEFVIYADGEDDGAHGDNNDGNETDSNALHHWEGTVLSQFTELGSPRKAFLPGMRLVSRGKENIAPKEEHTTASEIFLNFSSATEDDDTFGGLSSTEKTATKLSDATTTSTTAKADTSGGSEQPPETAAGGDDSSELGSEHYACPSEYMTALTHHSLSLAATAGDGDDANAAAGAKIVTRCHLKNPMYCAYDADIYRWHLHRERAGCPRNYMPLQADITESMRAVLIDWCVDVVTEFELCPATFFLAVSITDRTLSRVDCPRDKLQLLGAAALLTAAKMHEIFPPTCKDIAHATDDCYTEAQVQRMEKIILKATNFSLGFPLIDSFAEFFDYFAPAPLGNVQRHMMWYLLELSTLNFSAVHRHLPSRLAAAAFLIASSLPASAVGETTAQLTQKNEQQLLENILEENNEQTTKTTAKNESLKKWESMEQKTQILRDELAEPVKALLQIHRQSTLLENNKLKAVRRKFSNARHDRVALIELPRAFASQLWCD